MPIEFAALANTRVQQLHPYEPGKPISELARETGLTDIIKLASNENPLGASAIALQAAAEALSESALYPDGSGFALKTALAQKLGVSLSQLTLGNGSDNVLALIAQAFLKPNHRAVISEYAFSTFSIITRANHGDPIIVKARNYGHDLQAMAQAVTADTDLLFIANPNNPTGSFCEETALVELLNQVPKQVVVILDEAYAEYVEHPHYPKALALQHHYPNLIITRTFSKIYGLAGLRIGYGISHPEIMDILNRVRLPFNVSHVSEAAAIAALKDTPHVANSIANNRQGMAFLQNAFTQMGLTVLPSVANFLTVDFGKPAYPIYEHLLKAGIIVRPLLPYQMPNHLRITIGTPTQNQRLCETLLTILRR